MILYRVILIYTVVYDLDWNYMILEWLYIILYNFIGFIVTTSNLFSSFHFYFRAPGQIHYLTCTRLCFLGHVGILKRRQITFTNLYRSPDHPSPFLHFCSSASVHLCRCSVSSDSLALIWIMMGDLDCIANAAAHAAECCELCAASPPARHDAWGARQ